MGRSRYKILNEAYPYFHTLTVAGWQPVFTRQESVQLLFDSFIWLQENTDFQTSCLCYLGKSPAFYCQRQRARQTHTTIQIIYRQTDSRFVRTAQCSNVA